MVGGPSQLGEVPCEQEGAREGGGGRKEGGEGEGGEGRGRVVHTAY